MAGVVFVYCKMTFNYPTQVGVCVGRFEQRVFKVEGTMMSSHVENDRNGEGQNDCFVAGQ